MLILFKLRDRLIKSLHIGTKVRSARLIEGTVLQRFLVIIERCIRLVLTIGQAGIFGAWAFIAVHERPCGGVDVRLLLDGVKRRGSAADTKGVRDELV